jgi:hypothetical protein
MNDLLLIPVTESTLEQALREYEHAHMIWMNTSRFNKEVWTTA